MGADDAVDTNQSARHPWNDRVWWAAVAVGLLLRGAALAGLSEPGLCTRDECIFRDVARALLAGQGLITAPTGWLPAPGYPALLALCGAVFGRVTAMREIEILLTPLLLGLGWTLGRRAGGRAAGRWTAWGLALHPTLVFFSITTWTETIYALMLAATAVATLWARKGRTARAAVPGVLLGGTILLRGVAGGLFAVFGAALASSDRFGTRPTQRGRRLLAAALGLLVVVAPWSTHASVRHGGLIVSDATAGYVAWLGNSDFEPITYDYAIGPVDQEVYAQRVDGRPPPCPPELPVAVRDCCLLDHAAAWVSRHPGRFLARVPVRLAQFLNPHTFLTRHLRWNYAPALPAWATEVLVVLTALASILITLGGVLGAWARARGPLAIATVGVVAYHALVIACLYGTSRFRTPLEPLLLVWLGTLLAQPRAAVEAFHASAIRRVGAAVTLPLLAVAVGWYGWTAWPGLLW